MKPLGKKIPHLMPVGLTGIPRADVQIAQTIETLRTAQFEQDPLFDAGDSFRLSLCNSAVKREGRIIEAAIKDAVDQTPNLRIFEESRLTLGDSHRHIDVQFELLDNGWFVALEIKRSGQHDSGAVRQFRADMLNIPPMLRNALPLFPADNIRFHVVFVSGKSPLKEGLDLDDLGQRYGLHARSHVLTARQRYSAAIKSVLRERGL